MNTIDNVSLIEEMREGRKTSSAAFISFTDQHELFNTHVFCFYEGEDGKYYNQKIKEIIGENIFPIIVGNKKENLKLWRLIKDKEDYKNVHKMFFVDRDMDEIPPDKDEDLYVTPCYSIENFYANNHCFSNIIESEFSINKTESDFKKCMKVFEKRFDEFNQIMIDFNALIYLKAKRNIKNDGVNACDIKTNKLVKINIDGVKKHEKHRNEIERYRVSLSVSPQDVNQAEIELRTFGHFDSLFRGKNQFDFLEAFIKLLKELNETGKFFEKKRKMVSVIVDKNRISQLSQYAVFPEELRNFISLHKI